MLEELYVRNLGVLAEASVAFAPGLNVVTGETGAGKTLLLTSLGLLTGARGEARLVSEGADEAVVEALLAVPDAARERLVEQGFDDTDELVVVRKISSDGRSRAWINGRLAPVGALGQICGQLVEMHGQGAGFALARPAAQFDALDAMAGTQTVLRAYRAALACSKDLEEERSRLTREHESRERERDLLTYQVEEVERAALAPDEDEVLAAEIGRLEHAERLAHTGMEAGLLVGSDGAAGRLAEAHKALEDAARLDADLGPLAARVGALAAEAAEAAWDLRGWTEGQEPDPARLETLRERSALVSSLKRKYGGSIAEVLAGAEAARRRLEDLGEAGTRAAELESALTAVRTELDELATEMSSRRRRAARALTKRVASELPALGLAKARFEVVCDTGEAFGERGRDRVEFRFSAQGSRSPDLLGKVASGGELARAMIAVTLALAQSHATPVLVFDEADQGVGGEAALEVARRLARLGHSHQVLVVSHLPQIAAFAQHHVAVRKTDDTVELDALDETGRLAEISRMLAGLESSELARAHAAELVDLARAEEAGVAGAGARSA